MNESAAPATVFDISNWTLIEISGPDARSFLHNFCTNNINALRDGCACEALLLNVKGRILGHVFVLATGETLRLVGVPGQSEFLMAHLRKYHLLEELSITDRTGSSVLLFVTGDGALRVSAETIPNLGSIEPFQVSSFEENGNDKSGCLAARLDLFGEPGMLLSTDSASEPSLLSTLIQSGANEGNPEALQELRIQSGFPWYGIDLSEDNLAQEACRTEQAISFTKGCYLGQEPVARLHAMGHVNRQVRCVRIAAESCPDSVTPVYDPECPEKQIGQLTSFVWSSQFDSPVALGMLRVKFCEPGRRVVVGTKPPSTGEVFWHGADS